MTLHERLVKQAKQAIEEVFSDTSVDPEQTADDLQQLIDDTAMMVQSIKERDGG